MLSDRVSNPGPLTYESGAIPIALRGPTIADRCRHLGDIAAPRTVSVPLLSHYSLNSNKRQGNKYFIIILNFFVAEFN